MDPRLVRIRRIKEKIDRLDRKRDLEKLEEGKGRVLRRNKRKARRSRGLGVEEGKRRVLQGNGRKTRRPKGLGVEASFESSSWIAKTVFYIGEN